MVSLCKTSTILYLYLLSWLLTAILFAYKQYILFLILAVILSVVFVPISIRDYIHENL